MVGGGAPGAETDIDADPLIIAGRRFRSRLIVGTGKYKDYAQNAAAARAGGGRDRHGGVAARERDGARLADADRSRQPERVHLSA